MSGAAPATKCFLRCLTSKAARFRIEGTGCISSSDMAGWTAGKATGERTGHVATDGTADETTGNIVGRRGCSHVGKCSFRPKRPRAVFAERFISVRLVF